MDKILDFVLTQKEIVVWFILITVALFFAWKYYWATKRENSKESVETKKTNLENELIILKLKKEKEEDAIAESDKIKDLLLKAREAMIRHDDEIREYIEQLGNFKKEHLKLKQEFEEFKELYNLQMKKSLREENRLKNLLRKHGIKDKSIGDE